MRTPILILALAIAGCAQSEKTTKSSTPVVLEHPSIAERIRGHKQEQSERKAAEEATAETTVNGVIVR